MLPSSSSLTKVMLFICCQATEQPHLSILFPFTIRQNLSTCCLKRSVLYKDLWLYEKFLCCWTLIVFACPGVFLCRLEQRNMTTKDAYQYFVLRAQEMAISHNWIPVNWEETFNAFKEKLNPQTVVHNWLGPGVCPRVVAKGFRCIVSNQGVWYLDRLDIPWEAFYNSEPLEGINDYSQQQLVLGGEVCMWGETADTSDVQQTIWPRAAAAAERMWSSREATAAGSNNTIVLPRLRHFRCLLNQRGVPAAPVNSTKARMPPIGPGSCFAQ